MKGNRFSVQLLVGGENAYQKARAIAKSVFLRVSRILKMFGIPDFEPHNVNVECLGAEQSIKIRNLSLFKKYKKIIK